MHLHRLLYCMYVWVVIPFFLDTTHSSSSSLNLSVVFRHRPAGSHNKHRYIYRRRKKVNSHTAVCCGGVFLSTHHSSSAKNWVQLHYCCSVSLPVSIPPSLFFFFIFPRIKFVSVRELNSQMIGVSRVYRRTPTEQKEKKMSTDTVRLNTACQVLGI